MKELRWLAALALAAQLLVPPWTQQHFRTGFGTYDGYSVSYHPIFAGPTPNRGIAVGRLMAQLVATVATYAVVAAQAKRRASKATPSPERLT